ncbi:MAG: tRNA (guanine-N(1)-)-methyltransferase [Microgenomates group bacterium ADurb.Bin219]|nr:MAG: tRNA (guanine-N(1)-)-methyltransferase [Microgenomates group bacterium ADurb.Bin219]
MTFFLNISLLKTKTKKYSMKIDILTLFPGMFDGPFAESIIRRAQDKSLVEINIHNLRKWAKDKRGTVDDRPYGGGAGMVMMIEPITKALESLKVKSQKLNVKSKKKNSKVVLLSPRGKVWNQKMANDYSKLDHLILICGHYEGIDERVKQLLDEEVSIGDYILTGGEIPTMVLVDSLVRLIPGVLEKSDATKNESFSNIQLLEYPQYTRPENFQGQKVPKILLSGDPKKINKWREKEALKITKKNRPDLLK